MVHAYNCTKNTSTGYSSYYLLFGREPRLPIDVEFGLKSGNQQVPPSRSNYITQLRRRLRFAHKKVKQVCKGADTDMLCRGVLSYNPAVDNSDSLSTVVQLQQGCSSDCYTFISDCS